MAWLDRLRIDSPPVSIAFVAFDGQRALPGSPFPDERIAGLIYSVQTGDNPSPRSA
jgi:hypothetical protein